VGRLFDGANSKIVATTTDFATSPGITLIAWIVANSAGESNTGRIIRMEHLAGTVAELELVAGPVLRFNTNFNTTNAEATSSTAVATGVPQCVCATLTINAYNPALYIGSLTAGMAQVAYSVGPIQGSSVIQVGTDSVVVGNRSDQTGTFDGQIFYPTIFNRVLTLDEMDLFRRAYLPSTALYYWPLTQHDVTQSYEFMKGANGVDTSTVYADDPVSMRFYRPQFRNPRARPAPFKPGRPTIRIAGGGGVNL
jgi:hypothetical protein